MRTFLVVAAVVATLACANAYAGIGDQVKHTFLKFDALPLTVDEATAAGWTAYGECNPYLGTTYRMNGAAPTDYHPIEVLFTGAGQIAGVTVWVSGDQPTPLIPEYWVPVGDDEHHRISVSFRGGFDLCSAESQQEPLGDRVIINQDSTAFSVPLTNSLALEAGFFKGGCIKGMGTHWGYDIVLHPEMVFNATTALPIVPMYWGPEGAISAFLVMTPNAQEDVPVVGDWEGPFIDTLLCYNYCSSACAPGFAEYSHLWNTMHFMLHDHTINTCAAHCS